MTRKATLYRYWLAYQRRSAAARAAVANGIWLGLMDRPDLHSIDQRNYANARSYRTDAHTMRGLFAWEQQAIKEHFPEAGSLVVVGAGGGREVLALARMSYAVVGYECNPALVEYGQDLFARLGYSGAELQALARDEAPTDGGPYDGAVVGWSTYMLIAGSEQRIRFLRGLRARVREGAPILVSFFSRPAASRRTQVVTRVGNAVRTLRRQPPIEAGDDLVPNFVHRFTEAEVAAELQAGGFAIERFQAQGRGPYDSGYAVATARTPYIVR